MVFHLQGDRQLVDEVLAAGQLRHIGIGRTYAGTYVILLVQDLNVRVVHAAAGELLGELTIDPRRDYQPTGRPHRPTEEN